MRLRRVRSLRWIARRRRVEASIIFVFFFLDGAPKNDKVGT